MKLKKSDLKLAFVAIVVFVLYFLQTYFGVGIRGVSGLLFYFGVFLFLSVITYIFNRFLSGIAENISVKKADSNQLKREDDVLLQATGFTQATLFLYLNTLSQTGFRDFRWFVLLVSAIFYTLRGYAKIQDSNKYRYYSIYALIFVVATSIISLLAAGLPSFL